MKITSFISGFMLAILLSCSLIFWGCPESSKQAKTDPPEVSKAANPPGSCMDQLCKVYTEEDLNATLTGEIIREMTKAYAEDFGKSRINIEGQNARTAKEDALSVVFDLEKIKALIYMMESKNCNNNCGKNKKLGIRYYFIKYPNDLGNHPENDGLQDLPEDLRNKHSLVMVPAYFDKRDNAWYDYNPWGLPKTDCYPKIILDGNSNNLKQLVAIEPTDAGENHGGVGPPPKPGTFPTIPQ